MIKIALISLLFCTSAYAQTDVISIDQLSREDETAIQRGWQPDIGQCAVDTIREIRIDNNAGPLWVVVADDTNSVIVFEKIDGTSKYICQQGGRRQVVTGSATVQPLDVIVPY